MIDFLIIGSQSAMWYSNIFPLIKDQKIYLGYIKFKGDRNMIFYDCDNNDVNVAAMWFQNIYNHISEKLELNKKYKDGYEYLDNYPAIYIKSYKDIPSDFYDNMSVPIVGFLPKWNPDQFDIIDCIGPILNGKELFVNVIIKRKR